MQFPHYLEKGSRLAQDSARQQMRLREKCRRLPRRRDLLPVPYV